MFYLNVFTFVLVCVTPGFADASPCGDWDLYKDEKCIKVFADTLAYENAVKACHLVAADATLLTIRSVEEQTFMENLLFQTHKVHDAVWLGAKFDTRKAVVS